MENHTKRIRKARRQGLASRGDATRIASPRRGVSGTRTRGKDIPGEPRANARKKTLATTRKTKRTARSAPAKRQAAAMRE